MRSVLPWDWYRDPRVLAVEERRLFRPSWQYVGPLECVQRPGDQMVGRLLRVPVVVVRDGDGELRGFLNVCRHRGSLVVPADGNAPWLRCPYHAWTYGLDGTLRSAPQCGPEIAAEHGDLGLLPVRVATFGPFVFASAAAGSVTAGSYHLLLPNVKININPGRQNLSIGPVYPDGTDRTAGFLDYYFGADADEAWIERMMAFDTEVGDQDAALVAAAQAGVAGSWIDRGRILPQERLLADFQRYVHAACAGEVAPG
jgi:nitrite reductase/ring-hydroxylating ferredoxin subunit